MKQASFAPLLNLVFPGQQCASNGGQGDHDQILGWILWINNDSGPELGRGLIREWERQQNHRAAIIACRSRHPADYPRFF